MKYSQRNATLRKVPSGLSLPINDQGKTRDYLPLVLRLTHRNWKWKGPNGGATFEDAVSESVLALLQAKQRRNASPTKLITYAYHRIACAPRDLLKVEARYAKRFIPTAPRDIPEGFDGGLEARLSNSLLWGRVSALMEEKLSAEETLVLVRYYFHERTEAEIAEELSLKRYKVPVIRNGALLRLRAAFPSSSSRPFVV